MDREITDIPADSVGNVVQTAVDSGSTRVAVTRQPDGRYTVRYAFDG